MPRPSARPGHGEQSGQDARIVAQPHHPHRDRGARRARARARHRRGGARLAAEPWPAVARFPEALSRTGARRLQKPVPSCSRRARADLVRLEPADRPPRHRHQAARPPGGGARQRAANVAQAQRPGAGPRHGGADLDRAVGRPRDDDPDRRRRLSPRPRRAAAERDAGRRRRSGADLRRAARPARPVALARLSPAHLDCRRDARRRGPPARPRLERAACRPRIRPRPQRHSGRRRARARSRRDDRAARRHRHLPARRRGDRGGGAVLRRAPGEPRGAVSAACGPRAGRAAAGRHAERDVRPVGWADRRRIRRDGGGGGGGRARAVDRAARRHRGARARHAGEGVRRGHDRGGDGHARRRPAPRPLRFGDALRRRCRGCARHAHHKRCAVRRTRALLAARHRARRASLGHRQPAGWEPSRGAGRARAQDRGAGPRDDARTRCPAISASRG